MLATHHHLDHVGLAATIQRRAGARVAVLDRVADYAERYAHEIEEDRRFARALMAHHGVPEQVVDDSEDFWDFIRATTEDFSADVRLADGDRVRAGGRSLRVVARPGHSTTDTLFVDDRDAARVRRRPPAGRDLLEHRDPGAGPGPGRPRPLASALSRRPRAHAGDAARRGSSPVTARPSPTTRDSSTRACATIAAAASASSPSSTAGRGRRSRSPAGCGRSGR